MDLWKFEEGDVRKRLHGWWINKVGKYWSKELKVAGLSLVKGSTRTRRDEDTPASLIPWREVPVREQGVRDIDGTGIIPFHWYFSLSTLISNSHSFSSLVQVVSRN